jgi:hypothetical protein
MAPPTANEILDLIVRLFGLLDGNAASDVATTERRLGVRLPPVLRETYLGAGHRVRLWNARARGGWQLRGLGGLRRDGDMLVFATEQQACFEWAFSLGGGDVPVVFEGNDGAWAPTQETLGSFIRGLVLLHVSSCTRQWEEGAAVPLDRAKRFVGDWEVVPFRPLCTSLDFYVRGKVVLRCDWGDPSALFAGGADDSALQACAEALGFKLPEPWPDDVF